MRRPAAWLALAGLALAAAACSSSSEAARPAASSTVATTIASADASGDGSAPSTLPLYVPPATTAGAGGSAAPAVPLVPVADHPTPQLPATVDSANGSSVTVTDASRVLPLWGNISEIVFTLGLGDRVVGRDVAATFPEASGLPVVTQGHDVSAESVLSLRPTVVLAQTDTGPPEALEHIRNAGVPVVVVDAPDSLDDVGPRIQLIADALGVPEAGAALVDRTQAEIDAVQTSIPAAAEHPAVAFLYMRGTAGVYLMGGPGSGADSMIAAAGGIDAGTAMGLDDPFTPLTAEALVEAAPDVILMTTTGLESVGGIDGLVQIPGIAQTPAGLDRRIVTVEDGLLYSFGSRSPEALREIIAQLYPA